MQANEQQAGPETVRTGRTRSCSSANGRILGAIVIIVLGIALFLDNIGLLHFNDVWQFWPAYFLVVGLTKATGNGSRHDRRWGVILIIVGSLILGWNFGFFHLPGSGFNWLAGLILVAFGVNSLLGVLSGSVYTGQNKLGLAGQQPGAIPTDSEPVVSSVAIFASSKRRVEHGSFTGGSAQAIFGNVEYDLRQSTIPPGSPAVIDIMSIFGSVKMRVPYNWRVSMQAQGAFGSAEDKTVPDPRSTEVGPLLIITGSYLFGSVEVEN